MSKIRRPFMLLVILVLAISVSGCFLRSVVEDEPDAPGGDLLFTDFSEDSVNELPSRFNSDTTSEFVKVVADETVENGKVLQILGNPDAVIRLKASDLNTSASTLVVELRVRREDGNALNFHLLETSGSPKGQISWQLYGQTSMPTLRYHDGSGYKHVTYLYEGWNTLRLEANYKTGEVRLFLSNESGGVISQVYPFRVSVTSWQGFEFIIESGTAKPLNEAYFDYIRIWAIE